MPKEKSINPAQAQRKAEKAKAVKKGKAEAASRRNEKLARRNPERLQTQLNDLKAIETSGGKLTTHEKSLLESLEKEIKAVKKAREALGDSAPKFGSGRGGYGGGDRDRNGGRGGSSLGKRRRYDEDESTGSEVEEDVRRIPMPRDTPPPFPKEVLDKWYSKRRERIAREREESGNTSNAGTSANSMPLGANDRSGQFGDRRNERQPPPPVVEAKTVYEAKPVVRDLRKEAISFVPAAVRVNLDKGKGVGGLVEPEEADKLEKAGYMGKSEVEGEKRERNVAMEEVEDEDG